MPTGQTWPSTPFAGNIMNERIKELFQEAYSHFNKNGTYFTQELLAQKFAELVVRDCIDQIRKRKEIAIENDWNVDESMTIVEVDIEDWFGIDDDEDE